MDRLQAILLAVAIAFVLYQALMGWRLGVVRQLLKIGSLAAAYFGAVFFGDFALPMLRVTGYPDVVTRPLGAVLVGVLCYIVVAFSGRVLFKKTTDQSMGTVWFFYGITGSLLGVAFGLFFVALMAVALRFMGSFAVGIAAPTVGSASGEGAAPKGATVSRLVQVKETLESGMTGSVIRTIDPVPEQAYRVASKIGRVAGSPAAIQQFFTYPGAAKLAERPEISNLRNDPELIRALQEQRYMALLTHPSVLKAARSPKVSEMIRTFNLEAALDHALVGSERAPGSLEPLGPLAPRTSPLGQP